jgi:hypothetical protein
MRIRGSKRRRPRAASASAAGPIHSNLTPAGYLGEITGLFGPRRKGSAAAALRPVLPFVALASVALLVVLGFVLALIAAVHAL